MCVPRGRAADMMITSLRVPHPQSQLTRGHDASRAHKPPSPEGAAFSAASPLKPLNTGIDGAADSVGSGLPVDSFSLQNTLIHC